MSVGSLFGYPKHTADGVILTDWHGNVITREGRIVSRSRIPPGGRGSAYSSERVAYRFKIDGRWYHGRGYGDGMSLSLRPLKGRAR